MLDDVTRDFQKRECPRFDADDVPVTGIGSLSLAGGNNNDGNGNEGTNDSSTYRRPPMLSVFTRPNPWFLHPDEDLTRPLLMVGPGTGVAPFLGFLQHREQLMERGSASPTAEVGETWLFFGCRHQNRDFLYKTELERLHDRGVLTHLVTSFSRDVDTEATEAAEAAVAAAAAATPAAIAAATPASTAAATPAATAGTAVKVGPKYVQHRILGKREEIRKLLTHPTAMIYICGDAKNMARNVNDAFIEVLVGGSGSGSGGSGMTKMSAMKHLADLREQKRYLQDVWA